MSRPVAIANGSIAASPPEYGFCSDLGLSAEENVLSFRQPYVDAGSVVASDQSCCYSPNASCRSNPLFSEIVSPVHPPPQHLPVLGIHDDSEMSPSVSDILVAKHLQHIIQVDSINSFSPARPGFPPQLHPLFPHLLDGLLALKRLVNDFRHALAGHILCSGVNAAGIRLVGDVMVAGGQELTAAPD